MKEVTLTSEELEIILKYVYAIKRIPCIECRIKSYKACCKCSTADEWCQHFKDASENYNDLVLKYPNFVEHLASDIQDFIDNYEAINIKFEKYTKIKNKLFEHYPDILKLLVSDFCNNQYFDKHFFDMQ